MEGGREKERRQSVYVRERERNTEERGRDRQTDRQRERERERPKGKTKERPKLYSSAVTRTCRLSSIVAVQKFKNTRRVALSLRSVSHRI